MWKYIIYMAEKSKDFVTGEHRDFEFAGLNDLNADSQPVDMLLMWLQQAVDQNLPEAYAFTLATSHSNGAPTARVVYARKVTSEGIVFYTNYLSRKGKEMEKQPRVSVLFFWPQHERQIRIEGIAEKVSAAESDAYFADRPRNNQLGAWASNQSEKIQSRQQLEEKMLELNKKYEGVEVPRPPHWGGYIIKPTYFEFWQGRPGRLHDRIVFEKENNTWKISRLSP